MVDTIRTESALATLFADNSVGAISPQDLRDFLVSIYAGLRKFDAFEYGAVGDGSTDDSAAWTNAINACSAAGGGVVTAKRGLTYIVQNLPLLAGVYLDLQGITLKLPTSPTHAMFVAGNVATFQGGGIWGGTLDGRDNTRHCLDFTLVDQLDRYSVLDTYIHHFDRGFTGSENDRWPVFMGNRFWDNDVGVRIITNHPIIDTCDFRFNDVGLTGSINDLNVTNSKFNFNRIGVEPISGGDLINSYFTGCMFFQNDEVGATVTGRVSFIGGMLVGKNDADIGFILQGPGNRVIGVQIGYETSGNCFGTAAIRLSTASNIDNTLIAHNFFSVLGDGVAVTTDNGAGENIRNMNLSYNTVRLAGSKKFFTQAAGAVLHSKISGNSINVTATGMTGTNAIIEIASMSALGIDITDNTFMGEVSSIGGYCLNLPDVTGSIIRGNRFRNFTTPMLLDSNIEKAIIGDNVVDGVLIRMPSAAGFPTTVWPLQRATTLQANTANNRTHYFRCTGSGRISKIRIRVGTSSGNIAVAVYRNNGSEGKAAAPATRLATSGSVACPAGSADADVSLGATIDVYEGDWIAISTDNTTATFNTADGQATASSLGDGVHVREDTFPPPNPAGTLTGNIGGTWIAQGIA